MIQLSNNINVNGLTFSSVNPDIYNDYADSKDAEVFEKVVFDLMLNKYSDDKELTEYVLSLPKEQQRMAVLSLIDDDNNLWTKMNTFVDKCNDELEHIKDVIKIMFKFVKDGEVEKKKFGEVMTPLELVKEMLNTLPKDVWSNPNLRWLDPANGAGTFPLVVIYKLMKGLSSWEPNIEKRYKHIVENMIYTCELQSRNVFLWLCGVDPKDRYTTNTYWGSFLDSEFDNHMKSVWGVEKFDIVIGNPPYNTGTSGGNGGRDLWDKFVIKSLDIIEGNGYLVFVHPSKWRMPEHQVFRLFKENNLLFLEIHSKKDGQKVFGAITRYDFYCLQKSNYNGNTLIIDEKGCEYNINILEWEWLPNYNFDIIGKLISKDYENNCDVLYSRSIYGNDKRWMSKELTSENNLPCVYGMYNDGSCSYRYSSVDNGHFNVKKVILGLGEKLYPLVDYSGEFGIMNNAFAIKVTSEEEALNIKKAIESKIFSEIIKATKWSNFQTNYKMFKSFKKDFWKDFI